MGKAKEQIDVYCPYCKDDEEQYRVFKVDKNLDTTFCPHCGSMVDVLQAKKLFDYRISTLLKRAYILLDAYNDYYKAYKSFGYILQMDKDNLEALYGRLLSLIQLSTLRKSKIIEAFSLLKVEHKKYFSKLENLDSYFEFLNKIFHYLQSYIALCYKRLTTKNYFYDEECLALMITRTLEAKSSLEELLKYVKFVDKTLNNEKTNNKVLAISKAISDKEDFLKKDFYLTDGSILKYLKDKTGNITLTKEFEKTNKLTRFKPYSLNPINHKTIKINDQIFRSKKVISKVKKASLYLAIASLLISFTMFILMWFYESLVLTSIIVESIFFALAIVFGVIYIYSKKELTNKHHSKVSK